MDLQEALHILELDDTAQLSDARLAYRRLVRQWHPDRLPFGSPMALEASERMVQINSAWAVARRLLPDPPGVTAQDPWIFALRATPRPQPVRRTRRWLPCIVAPVALVSFWLWLSHDEPDTRTEPAVAVTPATEHTVHLERRDVWISSRGVLVSNGFHLLSGEQAVMEPDPRRFPVGAIR